MADPMSTPGEGQREAELRRALVVYEDALIACEEVLRLINEAAGPIPKGAPMPRWSSFEAWRMAHDALAFHNAGASVPEPASDPDIYFENDPLLEEVGTGVEGPNEPEPAFWQGFSRRRSGGRWKRVDNATFNYLDDGQAWCREESEEWESVLVPVFAPTDVAAPATQEAPSEPRETKPEPGDRVHDLKCWPQHFGAVLRGDKRCEIRFNDRHYMVGDVLRLREWEGEYTGRECYREVTHATIYHQEEGYIVLSIAPLSIPQPAEPREETK